MEENRKYLAYKDDLDAHINDKNNIHGVTKAQVGLGNVDNTADSTKTVAKAVQLVTARTINGVAFDGTQNISIDAVTAAQLQEVKNSVSDGKTKVANAITGKGISTATNATFDTMANNINAITTLSQGTADANATAAQILSGQTAYVKGNKITGTIPSKGAATITPGTYDQTIGAGQYLSGAQTIAGSGNLVPENIKQGVNIFGVVGNVQTKLFEGACIPVLSKTVYCGNGMVLSWDREAIVYGSNIRGGYTYVEKVPSSSIFKMGYCNGQYYALAGSGTCTLYSTTDFSTWNTVATYTKQDFDTDFDMSIGSQNILFMPRGYYGDMDSVITRINPVHGSTSITLPIKFSYRYPSVWTYENLCLAGNLYSGSGCYSTNGGQTWNACSNFPNYQGATGYTVLLSERVVYGNNRLIIYAPGYATTAIWVSENNGASWQQGTVGIETSISCVVFNSYYGMFYAWGGSQYYPGLFESYDGVNWSKISDAFYLSEREACAVNKFIIAGRHVIG